MSFGGFSLFESTFSLLFPLMFLLVFGMIIYVIVGTIRKNARNAASPRLTVWARVVNKREDYHHHGGTTHSMGHGWTDYYATFEVESGDRMELELNGADSGLLAEGDEGMLTFQGTKFIAFERKGSAL